MGDIAGRFPRGFVVAYLLSEILEASADPATVEKVLDEVFRLTIDLDWGRGRLGLTREGVGGRGRQKADVEDGMDSQSRRNVEAVGVRPNACSDLVRAKVFPVELFSRARSAQVTGIESDTVARTVTRSGGATAVSSVGVAGLGVGHLGAEVFEDTLHFLRE